MLNLQNFLNMITSLSSIFKISIVWKTYGSQNMLAFTKLTLVPVKRICLSVPLLVLRFFLSKNNLMVRKSYIIKTLIRLSPLTCLPLAHISLASDSSLLSLSHLFLSSLSLLSLVSLLLLCHLHFCVVQ